MKNKTKRVKLFGIIVIIFCLIFSSVPVQAYNYSVYGDHKYSDNVYLKLYYLAVERCFSLINQDGTYTAETLSEHPSDILTHKDSSVRAKGALVEINQTSKYDDGKVYCDGHKGEGDIILKLISLINESNKADGRTIGVEHLICDYNDPRKPGLLAPKNKDDDCNAALKREGAKFVKDKLKVGNTATNYFKEFMQWATGVSETELSTFNGNSTSTYGPESFKLYDKTFREVCLGTSYGSDPGPNNSRQSIATFELNSSGRFKITPEYITYKDGFENKEIPIYQYETAKCSEIARRIDINSEYAASYLQTQNLAKDAELEENKKNCAKTIGKDIEVAETIKNAISNRVNNAKWAASAFEDMLKLVAGESENYWKVHNLKPPLTTGQPPAQYNTEISNYLDIASKTIDYNDVNGVGRTVSVYTKEFTDNIKLAAEDIYKQIEFDFKTATKLPVAESIEQAKVILENLKEINSKAELNNLEKYKTFISEKQKLIANGTSDVEYRNGVPVCLEHEKFQLPGIITYNGDGVAAYTQIVVDIDPFVPVDIDPTEDPGGDSGGSAGTTSSMCHSTIGGLGWIACELAGAGATFGKAIYGFVEPLARVDDSIISQMIGQRRNIDGSTTNTAMFNVWTTMRDIANLLFVLLFMVIIFSQLTGFGIDNYGIKKMLPKLIVSAVLINASFFICALAIDASNIIGKSIQDLFLGIEVVGLDGNAVPAQVDVLGLIGTVLSFVGIGAAATTVYLGGMELIADLVWPLLIVLLVVIVSILFAFIVLGFRQALIIVLVILSPIAFACNILPNTEKLYKKWFDLFKAMLVMYPVVGLLIGGGTLAGKIMAATETNGAGALVGVVLQVVPYFLVPSLTRKSINAIDGLGGKLQGMSKRLGGFGKDKINNLDARQASKEGAKNKLAQGFANRYLRRHGEDVEARMKGETTRGLFGRTKKGVSNAELARYQKAKQTEHLSEQNQLKALSAYYDGDNFDFELEKEKLAAKAYETGLNNKTFSREAVQRRADINARAAGVSRDNILSQAGYDAAMTAIEKKERDTAVANYKSQIASDKGYSGVNKYNMSGMEELLRNSNTSGDLATALAESMIEKDAGAAADKFTDLLQPDSGVSEATKKAIAEAALSINGLKTKNTPLLKLANQTLGDDGLTNWKYDEFDIGGKISAETFSDIDKELLERQLKEVYGTKTDGSINYGAANKNDENLKKLQTAYRELAERIASNPQVISKLKSEQQWKVLELAAPDLDWKSIRSGTLKVQHD